MRRRNPKTPTSLDRKQQELADAESALRAQMEQLQQMITEAPRIAEQKSRQQREELLTRASEGRTRLDASVSLQDKRYGDDMWEARPRGALRKQRREGRLIFLVLLVALAGAVIWLATHLHF
jgi:hypothetical protein